MSTVSCWTTTDLQTQPRIRSTGPDRVEVTLVVGVWTRVPFAVALEPRAEISDRGAWRAVPTGQVRWVEITETELARRDLLANTPDQARDSLESTRYLVDVRSYLRQRRLDPTSLPPHRYFEVVVSGLPAGRLFRFVTDAVVTGGPVRATSEPAGLWLSAPAPTAADVVATHTLDLADRGHDDQWWVLMHTRDTDVEHLRLDLLSTHNLTRRPPPASNLPPVVIGLGTLRLDVNAAPRIGLGAPDDGFVSIRVDRSTDSVIITRRRRPGPPEPVVIITRADGDQAESVPVDLAGAPRDLDPVAVMIIAYAIQGLNDLFVAPLKSYQPPRSFAQVAFSDERALFSGRPETQETTVGDGYRFVLSAQRSYGIRTVWAVNSGALLLLKHSLTPGSFAELTAAVHDGLVSVANAGIGAHRNCCYTAETNVQEIARADRLIARVLTHDGIPARANGVYFPDSRIYQATPAELTSYARLRSAGLVDAIVLDRSTVAHGPAGGQQQLHFGNETATEDTGNYLWPEERTGLGLLLIEDRLRDQLVSGSEDEVPRGQLAYDLRRLFLRSLDQSRGHPRQLFCFGDDIDHLAGNGWFDGDYTNAKAFTHAFLAASCWFDDHPWMTAVTPDDPGFSDTFRRTDTLLVDSAIDATMDPGGAATQRYGDDPWVHFEDWFAAWRRTLSPWLGTTFGAISDALETALATWPAAEHNELTDLAWLYFLSCTHESMWSKQPVEQGAPRPLDQPFAWEPEDFAISETLQMRNAWVYLNAAVWARWAEQAPVPGNFVLDATTVGDPGQAGPLLPLLRAAHTADAWWEGAPREADGLHWDRDLLANVVLYNDTVLAVLDRNGGRVTQLFCRVGGRAVSVSGTNKAYQFLEVGPPQIACDGSRLQNTVFTVNHAYLATDVVQARPRPGRYSDQRNPDGENPTWLPDNFNAYACTGRVEDPSSPGAPGPAVVEAAYVTTPVADLPASALLSWEDEVVGHCERDGDRLRAGQPGVVWHEGAGFTKTISLSGRRLHVVYSGTTVGHEVANEFSVDLLDLLEGGDPQQRLVAPTTATVTGAGGVAVRVVLGSGCAFTSDTRRVRGPGSRVLTEDIRIRATGSAGFDYTIELPG